MAMTLRLTTDEDRALTLLASAWGCSKQVAAKRAVVATATRLLDDASLASLAREMIPGHAALEARMRQARGHEAAEF
ncbi:CopG family transcriptional regulator [Corynebacterium breve]|uniref:CopG family transcriptional regulator n=1 Tax=Corynebacterium breve TaxID=3049799 RepID=A0ABY8VHF6_9CORY|nr:CopG family transcriptional regulator [Corynebacterium breve]WIM67698.1 CopG family transcriptional regulator [Corynebacterium breve]